ncbi:MAG: TIGR03960 family B12-binding radical SAM protein [Lachnospiraceae bacterium]|nr:TIGR03960 family B12-binding radical SAM protein [Lachnospiraceae bacterium]
MRNLALSEDILNTVEKPARYVGGELNTVMKDPSAADLRFAFCFPDVYEIGMGNIGLQILYDQFNKRQDVWCERVYSPWPDLDKVMREKKIPLFALESQDPIRDFDFLGITLQYEMCYSNVLQVLDLSGIPLLAKDRTAADPIVIGGGPCTYNPEPIADFFDLFYIGEGEVVYDQLFDLYIRMKKAGAARQDFLRAAAGIEGIYVPSLYEPLYREDGTLADFRPLFEDVPKKVKRVIVKEMDRVAYPVSPIVPYLRPFQDRVTLEIMRGCIRGCRFCQAGMVYRPVRERSVESLKKIAVEALKASGYDEISLSSLSSSDYSELKELVTYLMDECAARHVNISLPSLRIDNFSLDVMSKVQDIKKSSLTFAAEAGTQRLRNVINKGITEEDILRGSAAAFHGGWTKVKFYFMLGLPTETEEDRKGIAELCERVAELFYAEIPKEERRGKIQITASSSFFVPKPFTPFEWAKMEKKEEYLARAHFVKDNFRAQKNGRVMHYEYHDADVTVLEGVFARGDRKIGAVIRRAYELGCLFDAWSEQFDDAKWQQAFQDCGVDPDFYTLRERSAEELFPWDFIDIGVSKRFLRREWERAMEGVVTPNCLERCNGCGAGSYGCGICPTNQNPLEQAARGMRGAAGKPAGEADGSTAAGAGEVTV